MVSRRTGPRRRGRRHEPDPPPRARRGGDLPHLEPPRGALARRTGSSVAAGPDQPSAVGRHKPNHHHQRAVVVFSQRAEQHQGALARRTGSVSRRRAGPASAVGRHKPKTITSAPWWWFRARRTTTRAHSSSIGVVSRTGPGRRGRALQVRPPPPERDGGALPAPNYHLGALARRTGDQPDRTGRRGSGAPNRTTTARRGSALPHAKPPPGRARPSNGVISRTGPGRRGRALRTRPPPPARHGGALPHAKPPPGRTRPANG